MVQQQFPVNDHKEEHPVIFEALEMDITEFKPVNTSKEHVYSINELLELSKEIPKHTIESISSMLPKRNFGDFTKNTLSHGQEIIRLEVLITHLIRRTQKVKARNFRIRKNLVTNLAEMTGLDMWRKMILILIMMI